MIATNNKQPLLRSKPREGSNRATFRLDEQSRADLAFLRSIYGTATGKRVTDTIIIRRALALLTARVNKLVADENVRDGVKAEASLLEMHK